MNRRELLSATLGAGALSLARPVLPAPRVTAPPLPPAPPPNDQFDLNEITISELQDGMNSGRYTARSLAERYLTRIEEIDRRGPGLRSIIELNPAALEIADSLDEERRKQGPRGSLHGIPILLKDNLDTADQMATSAGSLALALSRASRDAFVVQRLRQAGVLILGKTNLSEWANFRSSHSTSGWSARGGLTRNPYALDRNPCGSSSGSGVAVSANLAVAAVGTETDGSVVCPSSTNSIVGIKPTVGLISRSGIIPIAQSQDTAGPMTRTVMDAALLLSAMAGIDMLDPATRYSQGRNAGDYIRYLDAQGLKGARVGVVRNFFGFNEAVDRLMKNALEIMKQLGASLIDPADFPTSGKFDDSEQEVLLYEFKAGLDRYLSRLGPDVPARSLRQLIEFNEKNGEKELCYFGQDLFLKAQAKGPLSSPRYRTALKKNHRLTRAQGIDLVTTKHRLDALIAPTGGPPWLTDLVNGDHSSGGCSSPAAVSGYPHITVPAGYVHGLPVGISFFGPAYSEPVLIKLAYAFEQASRFRQPPRFLPTAEIAGEA